MKRCLVVDDSSVIRKIARHILEGLGYEVDEAENGRDALEHCNAKCPDVILLDWQLPVMGSTEFLTGLRISGSSKRPLIIYCTTENDAGDVSRAFTAGADDYLLKPFDRAMLESKLKELQPAA